MEDFWKRLYLQCLPYIRIIKSYYAYYIVVLITIFATIIFIRIFDKAPVVMKEKSVIDKQDRLCSLGLYSYCYNKSSNFNSALYLDIFEQLAKGADFRNISPDAVRSSLASVKYINLPAVQKMNLLDYLSVEINKEVIDELVLDYKDNFELLSLVGEKYKVSPYFLGSIWLVDSIDYNRYHENIFSILTKMLHKSSFSYEVEGKIYASMDIVSKNKIPPYMLLANQYGQLGNTRFSPQEYVDYGVDFDDGIVDVWSNKLETISSIAKYLQDNGWPEIEHAESYSVISSSDFNWNMSFFNFGVCQGPGIFISEGKSLLEWKEMGIIQDNKLQLPESNNTFYFVGSKNNRSGNSWHGFLVSKGYFAVMRYACSTNYGVKIMLLAKILKDISEKNSVQGDVIVEGNIMFSDADKFSEGEKLVE